jgi:uncharacterized protein YqjF (DUF2071 family)
VYFFSLDAASRLAVAGARAGFGLPYFHARMYLRREGGQVYYLLQRLSGERPRFGVRYELGEDVGPAAPGTLAHFLLERYLLHVERRVGGLWTTQVHHRPYPVQRARVLEWHDELVRAAGLPPVEGPPLVHYAARVDVDTFAPRPRRFASYSGFQHC